MAHQWYWQTSGEQYGPLSTEELEDLFRRHRIADADQIRLEESEEWLPAAEVRAMFSAPVEGAEAEKPSQSAARILAEANRRMLGRSVDEVRHGPALGAWLGRGGQAFFEILAGLRDRLFDSLEGVRGLLFQKGTLAVAALLVIAFLLKDVSFGNARHRTTHERLAAAWERMQELRKAEAPDADWLAFERETSAWLDPLVRDLKKASAGTLFGWPVWQGAGLYTQRELWFAARNLQDMLRPPRGGEPRQQREFVTHLGTANDYLTGKRSHTEVENRQREIMARLPVHVREKQESDSPLMSAIIAVDVALVVGGLLFWWRRR